MKNNEIIRGLFLKESELQSEVMSSLNLKNCRAHNMHGNMYQSGIPDVLIQPVGGQFAFHELKMDRRKTIWPHGTYEHFEYHLEGAQKLVIREMLARKGRVGIVVYDMIRSMRDGRGHMVYMWCPYIYGNHALWLSLDACCNLIVMDKDLSGN